MTKQEYFDAKQVWRKIFLPPGNKIHRLLFKLNSMEIFKAMLLLKVCSAAYPKLNEKIIRDPESLVFARRCWPHFDNLPREHWNRIIAWMKRIRWDKEVWDSI